MLRFSFCLAVLAATLLVAEAGAAPITLSVSGGPFTKDKIGDTLGTNLDILAVVPFGPTPHTVPVGTPTTVTHFIPYTFEVGINASVPALGSPLMADIPLTIDGVSGVFHQPFQVDISYSDTLTFLSGGPTTTFFLPSGYRVDVTPLAQAPATYPVGTYSGFLSANVLVTPVPEPTTMAVFGACLAGAGVYGWRRRRTATV